MRRRVRRRRLRYVCCDCYVCACMYAHIEDQQKQPGEFTNLWQTLQQQHGPASPVAAPPPPPMPSALLAAQPAAPAPAPAAARPAPARAPAAAAPAPQAPAGGAVPNPSDLWQLLQSANGKKK
jgi:hypothetical protein